MAVSTAHTCTNLLATNSGLEPACFLYTGLGCLKLKLLDSRLDG